MRGFAAKLYLEADRLAGAAAVRCADTESCVQLPAACSRASASLGARRLRSSSSSPEADKPAKEKPADPLAHWSCLPRSLAAVRNRGARDARAPDFGEQGHCH